MRQREPRPLRRLYHRREEMVARMKMMFQRRFNSESDPREIGG
jgi:hypothetical protein